MTRQEILELMRAVISRRRSFWGIAASGKGDAARAKKAGASWVTVTHAGALDPKVPASAIGLLPYANANDGVLERKELAKEVKGFPVLAGVFAPDQFQRTGPLLERLRESGFHGVQNFPSTGLAEGRFGMFFRETGMDYAREIEMAGQARAMDFFVSALVFTPEHAESMALAGADMVVFHPGLSDAGEFCGDTRTAEQRFLHTAAAARKHSKNILAARLVFKREFPPEPGDFGVQYDYNI